jgi:hypothetical protein
MEENNAVISAEQIIEKCADKTKSMTFYGKTLYGGFDFRNKNYDFGFVVMLSECYGVFNIECAYFHDGLFEDFCSDIKTYNPVISFGSYLEAQDINHKLKKEFGDLYISGIRACKVADDMKVNKVEWPVSVVFSNDAYISKVLDLLKNGKIKFPYANHKYETDWFIEQCKVELTDPENKYCKYVCQPGFYALVNAYLAWLYHTKVLNG